MKKALIHIPENEIIDVHDADKIFGIDEENYKWIDCPDDCVSYRWTLKDGVPTPPVLEPIPYNEKRRMEYPTWQIQQDMQYWDAINGTTTWQDLISEIKAKHPKE